MVQLFYAIKGWFIYLSLIRENLDLLNQRFLEKVPQEHGFRKDWIKRLYTVINVPIRDNHMFSDEELELYVQQFLRRALAVLDQEMVNLNMKEYVMADRLERLDDFNYLVILGYRRFDLLFWSRFFFVILFIILIIVGFLVWYLTTT